MATPTQRQALSGLFDAGMERRTAFSANRLQMRSAPHRVQ
jgi:hypothetical protein